MEQPSVEVNRDQCQKMGEVLKGLRFRPTFYNRPFLNITVDRETKFRMMLFPLAICHQTHTLANKKRNLVGWDYLEDVYLQLAKDGSDLLDVEALARMTIEELIARWKPLFSEDGDPEHCTLDRLEERARFVIDIARQLSERYGGRVESLIEQSGGYLLNDGRGLYESLERFEAYADPMRKKSTCFIKFACDAGMIAIKDPEHYIPIMDYHMQRVLLRCGCVEILDADLKTKLQKHESLASDEEIRRACVDATWLLSSVSGFPVVKMNDFLWSLGRSCCKDKMLCVDHMCNKNPCSFDLAVELPDHTQCVFADFCKACRDESYRALWQPIVETHYY